MREETGYTVAEVMMAVLIFGLIIAFVIPIFFESKASTQDQMFQIEGTTLLHNQIEYLSKQCTSTKHGSAKKQSQHAPQTVYLITWSCETLSHSLIKIDVVVQWTDKEGVSKTSQMVIHRYQPKLASPI